MNFPDDRKYAKTHEWLKMEGEVAVVGLSDYAQQQLTDIIFADLPAVGSHFDAGAEVCSVESVKAVGYIYAPISGVLTEVNELLKSEPEKLNTDPYGAAWLFKVKPDDPQKTVDLMNAADYQAFTESL
jgi:glycine cleavage system H protein